MKFVLAALIGLVSAQSACPEGYEEFRKENGKRACRLEVVEVDEFDLDDPEPNMPPPPEEEIREACPDNTDYRTKDGRCLPCPVEMMAGPGNKDCIPMKSGKLGHLHHVTGSCGPEEIYTVHGHFCIHCPVDMRPAPDGTRCIPYEHGRMTIHDFHSDCGQNQIPQPGGGCISYDCNERQRVLPDGMCQYCPAFSNRMLSNPFYCAPHACTSRQKLLPSGQCEQCPPFTLTRGFYCSEQQCRANEYLTPDGECNQCPPRHIQTPDQRGCQYVTCQGNSFVTFEGYCIPCPKYTTVSHNGMTCTMPRCAPTQIFTVDGFCDHCPQYQRPVGSGYGCQSPTCNDDQEVQMDGTCKNVRCQTGWVRKQAGSSECRQCPLYTRPDESGFECIVDECTRYQYLRVDGTCAYCGAFMRPKLIDVVVQDNFEDVSKQMAYGCERPVCGMNSILKVNGECEACGDGQMAVAGGYYCDESSAPRVRRARKKASGDQDDDDHDDEDHSDEESDDDHDDDHGRRLNEVFEQMDNFLQ